MSLPLRFRQLGREDLPFADSLRALAGWNQTPEDWKRFLAIEPTGCFLAEWNGAPAGTATTIVYGPELAWVGMVLVHPEFRRRGIGQGLLRYCIDSLRDRGVRCIKLDATPLGKTVYDGLGFRDEWTLKRWVRSAVPTRAISRDAGLRPWRAGDESLVGPLDAEAFGCSRRWHSKAAQLWFWSLKAAVPPGLACCALVRNRSTWAPSSGHLPPPASP